MKKLAVLLCLPVVVLLPSSAYSTEIILSFQNTQPKYIIQGEELSGLCYDIYKSIEEHVKDKGITFRYPTQYVPLKRIFDEMTEGTIHMYCGAGKNNERTTRLFYSDVPLYEVKTLIVSRKGDTSAANSVEELVKSQSSVMVLRGTSTERFLRKKNIQINHISPKSITQALKLIYLKRARYFAYHDVGLHYHITKYFAKDTFKFSEMPVRSYFHWMVFSKYIDQESLFHIKQAINEIVKMGEIRNMRKKYE